MDANERRPGLKQNGIAPSRRIWLVTAAVLVASLAAIPMVFWRRTSANPKGPRDKYRYQDRPNDEQRCADCYAYVANHGEKGMGSCIVIPGPISVNGWCTAFAPKEH